MNSWIDAWRGVRPASASAPIKAVLAVEFDNVVVLGAKSAVEVPVTAGDAFFPVGMVTAAELDVPMDG